MPLEESYWESMKSGVADMVNTGGRQGGAITAALFLKQVMPLIIPSLFLVLFFPLKRSAWHIALIVLMENYKKIFRPVNGQGHGTNLVLSQCRGLYVFQRSGLTLSPTLTLLGYLVYSPRLY